MIEVVGTMFFKNKKLLIDKPRKRDTYQMIGGKVEKGESPLEAAIRECREELGAEAIFDKSLFKLVMDFDEIATSNPNQKIHFYVFQYAGDLEGKLIISEEIENFLWYNTNRDDVRLSNTLKNEVIPYCLEKNLID